MQSTFFQNILERGNDKVCPIDQLAQIQLKQFQELSFKYLNRSQHFQLKEFPERVLKY